MLTGILAGCSATTQPVQPVRFFPATPVAPVPSPFQSTSKPLPTLPASPVATPLHPLPESSTELAAAPVVTPLQPVPASLPAASVAPVVPPLHDTPEPLIDPKSPSVSPPSDPGTVVPFEPQPVVRPSRFMQTGIASWYGPGFHGKRTANGEIYDQNALTAAHRSLPLGTQVMVTNLENERAIEVRINDRGPFVEGRIIDLSLAGAKSIGVYAPGTALVRIEVLSAPTPRLAVLYAAQVGSYTDADKASNLKQALTQHFPSVYISPLSSGRFRYYQVRLGPFTERVQAERQARSAARAGLQSVVVEEDDRWAEW